MAHWEQIGGDINADRYGAILAKYEPPEYNWVDVVEIKNLEDSLRDDELLEFGAGYLVGIASFDAEELDSQFDWALEESGIPQENWERMRRMGVRDRRLFVADTLVSQGMEDTEPVDGTFGDALGRFIDDPSEIRWNSPESIDLNYDPLAKLRGSEPSEAQYPEHATERTPQRPWSALNAVHIKPYVKVHHNKLAPDVRSP